MDFGALIDEAVDRAGLRETAVLLSAPEPFPEFMVDFRQPQQVVFGDQAHVTFTTIEYSTGAVRELEEGDRVLVHGAVYRVLAPPTFLLNGHWSVADLELDDA